MINCLHGESTYIPLNFCLLLVIFSGDCGSLEIGNSHFFISSVLFDMNFFCRIYFKR